jgi:trehalose 6-phosphate synthase/phosphatase
MSRLIIVSNRLPVTVRAEKGQVSVVRSSGGLATALRGPHERLDALWIGWPGDVARLSPEQRGALDAELEGMKTIPVHLGAAEVHRYYDGFSNGVLWPLFHYLIDKVNLDARADWDAYRAVNERFASAVAEHARPGDRIWIHDYQLMLLPELIRRRLPDARIGFFLHIPFPAAEVFRILPWREQILRGLLGADLLGFHTAAYRQHFVYAAARVLGIEPDVDAIEHQDRRTELGVHPISVDAEEIHRLSAEPSVQAEAQRMRDEARGRKIVLGIDRLDYTKGIRRRLIAFEHFLEREPAMRSAIRFIQLGVPTRERVDAYADFRKLVHETVGRINGHYGSVDALPIHYLHRSLTLEQVVALYLAADVMLVTPLRDGMNLVAKEYVAARRDEGGVLVLSEFAGAAAELSEAIHVNPYDIDALASAIRQAVAMPPEEQRLRMRALRKRVFEHDVHRWAHDFLGNLARCVQPAPSASERPPPSAPSEGVLDRLRAAPSLSLALDYDGTLVPLAPTPDLAAPDPDLLSLLRALGERPRTQVHVVSGRTRESLERWLGALPISLHAEHGFWSRERGTAAWTPLLPAPAEWKGEVRRLLQALTERTAGSFIEEKTVMLAWHYRPSDPELAALRSRELRSALATLLKEWDLELLTGSKVLEVRPRGLHKGRVVPRILSAAPPGGVVVAIGDDRTDEDLFAALPATAVSLRVGGGLSRAAHRLEDPGAVRAFLRALLRS